MKTELTKFFTWLRNGICFTVTWLLLLMIITGSVAGNNNFINCTRAAWLLVFCTVGVLIFCVCFTKLFIRKMQFTARLSIFMALIAVYQLVFGYIAGIFTHFCSYQIILFISIISVSYLVCFGFYLVFRKKAGELYTNALHEYQKKRASENN